jgi:hypothetical protein
LLLLRVDALLVLGAAEGKKRDDIGFRKRRLGAVGDLELVRRAVETESDVVVLHAGGCVEIDIGLDADGIVEVNVAALQLVLRSSDGGAAFGERDAAEKLGEARVPRRWISTSPASLA